MAAVCISILLSGTVISAACSQDINAFGYSFDHPDHVYELSDSLAEISGLTLLDGYHLGAIDDDSSKLFIIDLQSGNITGEHNMKMGRKQDYEGIERVGSTVYVLASAGTIHEIQDWENSKRITASYKTGLSAANDNEGLAYDAANHRLLIACKEYPGKGMKGYKTVYAFDLEQKRMLPEPVFKIDLDQVEAVIRSGRIADAAGKKKKKKSKKKIRPAALAVHPLTQQLFVVSSARRRLIILNSDGSLAAAYRLPKKYFVQAEGMAFLPNGDLFISNERANRKAATLLRFNYRPVRQ
ncbi:MAG: hypothetical protein RQ867_01755 [Mariprofundaceae bacterium]|nr:hypothetical protein [Mariprofundaceae bacterium]